MAFELYILDKNKPEKAILLEASLPPGSIQEAREYIFELRNVESPDSYDLQIDDDPVEALRSPSPRTARWRWSPGFQAGTIGIRLLANHRPVSEFECTTDPDLRKITRANFETMVRDILEDSHALFALSSFRIGVARGTGRNMPPIARLEFLRLKLDELERVVRAINSRPVRVLRASRSVLPLHRVQEVTGEEILRSFASTAAICREVGSGRLPVRLKGLFPSTIRKFVKQEGTDIREHRDIKGCLQAWAAWLSMVADKLENVPPPNSALRDKQIKWARRCRLMVKKLRALLALPLFLEVAEHHEPILMTPIYRRVPRYLRFFQLQKDYHLGISDVLGDFLQIPLARTFDLYELWCFFRLLRAITFRTGSKGEGIKAVLHQSAQSGSLTIAANAVTVEVVPGISLGFQRSFSEYWLASDKKGSFSHTMIPDITLAGSPDSVLILLDAKYRIDTQLNDAINSLHVYRDALVVESGANDRRQIVTSAYILTPRCLDPVVGDWKNAEMPGRLFHRLYRGEFKFGAVCLQPGMTFEQVCQTLDAILHDSGVTLPGVAEVDYD